MEALLTLFNFTRKNKPYFCVNNYKDSMSILLDSQDYFTSGKISRFLSIQIEQLRIQNKSLSNEDAIKVLIKEANKHVI